MVLISQNIYCLIFLKKKKLEIFRKIKVHISRYKLKFLIKMDEKIEKMAKKINYKN
jgi:hypothetical protein